LRCSETTQSRAAPRKPLCTDRDTLKTDTTDQFDHPVNGAPLPLWPGDVPGLNPAWKDWVPTITPYLLETGRPRGIVIAFPGGAYNTRAEHERTPIAEFFNAQGFHSAVLDYRVQNHTSPRPLGKGPLWDAQRAIRLVRSHAAAWAVRPDRIAVVGFSAGGHLVAMAGTHFDAGDADSPDPAERVSCRPDALIMCYAAIMCHPVTKGNILGEGASDDDYDFFAGEKNVTAQSPPAFLWHTAEDAAVPVENSLVMARALHAAGVGVELHVFPTGRHGLALALDEPQVSQWTGLCVEWLKALDF